MFETKKIKAALGGIISVTSLASGLMFLPADQSVMANSKIELFDQDIPLETQKSLVNVLPGNTGVSQEFHLGHPGMDITAPLGTKIHPLKDGVVVLVSFSKFDYGRMVIVDHGNGLRTRYAHMGKVFVEEGEKISTDQIIGEVGITGHTTGPHLHFEVMKNDKTVNPRPYLNLSKNG